eukprot:6207764-Pleurochrysis_carterae.AAC.3
MRRHPSVRQQYRDGSRAHWERLKERAEPKHEVLYILTVGCKYASHQLQARLAEAAHRTDAKRPDAIKASAACPRLRGQFAGAAGLNQLQQHRLCGGMQGARRTPTFLVVPTTWQSVQAGAL